MKFVPFVIECQTLFSEEEEEKEEKEGLRKRRRKEKVWVRRK